MPNHVSIELATTVQRFAALRHSIDEEYGASSQIGAQADMVHSELEKLLSQINSQEEPIQRRKAFSH
jgi:hypothetical protein